MFTVRNLTIIAIVLVVFCVGFFSYLQYDMKKFAENLPPVPAAVETPTQAQEPAAKLTQSVEQDAQPEKINTPIDNNDGARTAEQTDTSSPATAPETKPKIEQSEIDKNFTYAFSILEDSFDFNTADPQEMEAMLSDLLNRLHENDPRVATFIEQWHKVYTFRKDVEEYNAGGYRDKELFFSLLQRDAQTLFPETLELGIALMKPSEATMAPAQTWVDDWVDRADKSAAAQIALEIANEAYLSGDMTVKEAEQFIEDVSGKDDVEVVPITEEDTE